MNNLVFLLAIPFCLFGQKNKFLLPDKLNELSGLAYINDTVLVGHNDSGDSPNLYFITTSGTLLHTCWLTNVKSIDWEDICFDGTKYLYIGDIGNNENQRKNLKIIRVDAIEAFKKNEIKADSFSFTYPDQTDFPAVEKDKHFDAEALTYYQDKLYIFTKCRTEPWDGKSFVYQLSTNMKSQTAVKLEPLYVGKSGWWQDAITGADIQGNYCYLLTYNRLMVYEIDGGKMKFISRTYLDPITQKEAVAVNKKGEIMVGDERSKMLGGGFIYPIEIKWKK